MVATKSGYQSEFRTPCVMLLLRSSSLHLWPNTSGLVLSQQCLGCRATPVWVQFQLWMQTGNPRAHPDSLQGRVRPYSLTDHIHEREVGYHLSTLLGAGSIEEVGIKVAFVSPSGDGSAVSSPPRVCPSTIHTIERVTIVEMFEERYKGEKLI